MMKPQGPPPVSGSVTVTAVTCSPEKWSRRQSLSTQFTAPPTRRDCRYWGDIRGLLATRVTCRHSSHCAGGQSAHGPPEQQFLWTSCGRPSAPYRLTADSPITHTTAIEEDGKPLTKRRRLFQGVNRHGHKG